MAFSVSRASASSGSGRPSSVSARAAALQRRLVEPVEHQHQRARQQRAVELEGRVLGGGADQRDGAVLHVRQEAVLLRAVEAVDLVDEQQRALAGLAPALGAVEGLAQVLHAREDGRELLEGELGLVRQQPRHRGLAGARRAPQDHALQAPAPSTRVSVPSGRRDGFAPRPPRASSAAAGRRAAAAPPSPCQRLGTGSSWSDHSGIVGLSLSAPAAGDMRQCLLYGTYTVTVYTLMAEKIASRLLPNHGGQRTGPRLVEGVPKKIGKLSARTFCACSIAGRLACRWPVPRGKAFGKCARVSPATAFASDLLFSRT